MIDLKPTTNPLDVPAPLPSEIVRNWPGMMWGKCYAKKVDHGSGRTMFCAIGIVNEADGYEWGGPTESDEELSVWVGDGGSDAFEFFRERHGLSHSQVVDLTDANDALGKDAAADLLESWGM